MSAWDQQAVRKHPGESFARHAGAARDRFDAEKSEADYAATPSKFGIDGRAVIEASCVESAWLSSSNGLASKTPAAQRSRQPSRYMDRLSGKTARMVLAGRGCCAAAFS